MRKTIIISIIGLVFFSGCDGSLKEKINERKSSKELNSDYIKVKKINKSVKKEINLLDKEILETEKSIQSEKKEQLRKQLKAEREGKVNVLAGQRENMWD
jgi:uncharacterized protein YlxW (UPF0749 family)